MRLEVRNSLECREIIGEAGWGMKSERKKMEVTLKQKVDATNLGVEYSQ